jgi:hypothetical protein
MPHATPPEDADPHAAGQTAALEARIAALRDQLARIERASDRDWEALAGAARTCDAAVSDASVSPAALEFVDVMERRNHAWEALRRANAGKAWTPQLEARANDVIDPLWHDLGRLADKLGERPASGPIDIRIKALALRDLCEEKSDDIVHRLAASLAADLLR